MVKIFRDTTELRAIDGGNIGRWRSYEKTAELLDGLYEHIEDTRKSSLNTVHPLLGEDPAYFPRSCDSAHNLE